MRTTWEKVVQMVSTEYGQDICNELQNKTTVTLVQPAHDAGILLRHTNRVTLVRNAQQNLQTARRAQRTALQTAVTTGVDPDAPMKLAFMDNEIAQGDFEANNEVASSSQIPKRLRTATRGARSVSATPTYRSIEVRRIL